MLELLLMVEGILIRCLVPVGLGVIFNKRSIQPFHVPMLNADITSKTFINAVY